MGDDMLTAGLPREREPRLRIKCRTCGRVCQPHNKKPMQPATHNSRNGFCLGSYYDGDKGMEVAERAR